MDIFRFYNNQIRELVTYIYIRVVTSCAEAARIGGSLLSSLGLLAAVSAAIFVHLLL